jgi:hypothetical protein
LPEGKVQRVEFEEAYASGHGKIHFLLCCSNKDVNEWGEARAATTIFLLEKLIRNKGRSKFNSILRHYTQIL